jgi:predicted nucleic acid-binding protein
VLQPTQRHTAVLAQTLSELPDLRGNLMHDLHTAVLMREHGVSRICTRDTDFHRFTFLTVVDPLR